mmetsp:Transcript_114/g.302  ORF Transcript_114/g.302 Transcript_114/m.302 type:complete len:207 (+) Transcript_114:60-680(+)
MYPRSKSFKTSASASSSKSHASVCVSSSYKSPLFEMTRAVFSAALLAMSQHSPFAKNNAFFKLPSPTWSMKANRRSSRATKAECSHSPSSSSTLTPPLSSSSTSSPVRAVTWHPNHRATSASFFGYVRFSISEANDTDSAEIAPMSSTGLSQGSDQREPFTFSVACEVYDRTSSSIVGARNPILRVTLTPGVEFTATPLCATFGGK